MSDIEEHLEAAERAVTNLPAAGAVIAVRHLACAVRALAASQAGAPGEENDPPGWRAAGLLTPATPTPAAEDETEALARVLWSFRYTDEHPFGSEPNATKACLMEAEAVLAAGYRPAPPAGDEAVERAGVRAALIELAAQHMSGVPEVDLTLADYRHLARALAAAGLLAPPRSEAPVAEDEVVPVHHLDVQAAIDVMQSFPIDSDVAASRQNLRNAMRAAGRHA